MKKSVLFIAILFSLSYAGCINALTGERGNGNVIKEERSISSFDAIDASGGLTINLVRNDSKTIEVTADENLMDNIETYVRGGTLHIDTKNISNSTKLEVLVNYQDVEFFDLSGAVDVYCEDVIEQNSLNVDASGASEMELNLRVNKLSIDVSGAGDIRLEGKADEMVFEGSGASSLRAENLETKITHVDISGAGDARVNASEELKASVSGAGSIRYTGNPESIKTSVSGAGSVNRL